MGTITNHAKKLLLSLFTMLASLLVNAESVTIDNITYNIIKKAGIAEVTKCNSHTSGDLVIPNTIIYDEVEFEVKKIINNAFSWCDELTSVTIPENITSIGYSAFYNCSSLVAVHCNSIASWCNISFGDEDANPLYYAGKLYINNELLTEITIPEGIRSIGDYTFINCDSLTTVNIPESVISIGGYAFSGCGNLTSIIIPEGVSTIKGGTFSDYSSLTTMSIPQSLLKIEKNAFERCEAITNIHITSVEDWLKIEFEDRSSYPHVSRYMIGNHPYVNFYTKGELLTEVVIPETINSIPDYAFYYCNNLTSLTISEGVTKIGDYAFEKCNNINSIILPQSLSSIGESAFRGCEGIIDIYCYAEKLPSIEYNTFYAAYPEYATLHVPANAIEKYRTTSPWSDFGNFETLEVMVEEINLNHSSNILLEGESLSLTVTVIPDDATDGSVIWNSSDSSVATVDNTGKVTAIAPGTATITAMANDGSGVSASCEVTVVARSYALTFLVDGDIFLTDTLTRGTVITLPEEPTKEGHTFSGWGKVPETMPAEDLTISGTFIVNKYLVTFKIGDEVVAADSLEYKSAIVAPEAPEKEGYTFNGWGVVADSVPAHDLTYEGSYSINSYVLTYVVDGEAVLTWPVVYGATIPSLKAPEKEDYTFSGWGDVPETMPAKDVTIEGTFTQLPSVYLTINQADNGYVKQHLVAGSVCTYTIEAAEGWKIHTVTFNGDDVTSQLTEEGTFTTPALQGDAVLNIAYEKIDDAISHAQASRIKVQGHQGIISIAGTTEGAAIGLYTTSGTLVATATAEGESTQLTVPTGQVYIVKVADTVVKIGM